ncbi:DUF3332 family protein [Candidatus Sumerlaeota bacterium]|nr:DUF3332 family protein [Candidatus Sumerlaeota bacterium]
MIHQLKTDVPVLERLRRRGRLIALLCLIVMAPIAAGCYGRFPLTKAVHKFNGKITDNEIIHNVVFWLFVIFPVYYIAQLGDAVIFNLIEFWTGSKVDLSSTTQQGDQTFALKSSPDGNELILTVTKRGEKIGESKFVRVEDGKYEVRDAQDRLTGMVVKTPDGNLNLTDANGRVLKTINPEGFAANAGI